MKYLSVLIGSLLCVIITACSNNANYYAQVTDAPALDYTGYQKFRSRMHQLAFELQVLDSFLIDEYDEGPLPQQLIVDSLRNIERIAQALEPGDLNSMHPFLLQHRDRLLSDVKAARMDAERYRYYMADRISGACASCIKQFIQTIKLYNL